MRLFNCRVCPLQQPFLGPLLNHPSYHQKAQPWVLDSVGARGGILVFPCHLGSSDSSQGEHFMHLMGGLDKHTAPIDQGPGGTTRPRRVHSLTSVGTKSREVVWHITGDAESCFHGQPKNMIVNFTTSPRSDSLRCNSMINIKRCHWEKSTNTHCIFLPAYFFLIICSLKL